MSDFVELIKLLKEIIILSAGKVWRIYFLFSSITTFCVFYFDDIFDTMYIGLIKTLCSLSLIFCASYFFVEFACVVSDYFKERIAQAKIKRENEEREFTIEQEKRNADNRLRALLLYLPPEVSSVLMYVYNNISHAAYLPCDDALANQLYSCGCLESRLKAVVRAYGYKRQAQCFYYKVPSDIVTFLDEHIKELGSKWSLDNTLSTEKFKIYQRAGKSVVLE